MFDAVCLPQDVHHGVVQLDRIEFRGLHRHIIGNGDVASETDYLIPDGVFESQNDTYTNHHHCQSDCHTNGGNTNSRTGYFLLVSLVGIDLSCDE